MTKKRDESQGKFEDALMQMLDAVLIAVAGVAARMAMQYGNASLILISHKSQLRDFRDHEIVSTS